tara:strand:- start:5299 stop:5937 length:639 start_codon:yes stop_codon:yes gene_type:complete
MDGNNRWSKKNNLAKYDSYYLGAKKLLELTKFIFDNFDISYVSAFALSKHNLKRGSSITNIIQRVLSDFLDQNINKNSYNFKIVFKGNLNFLPFKIVKSIKELENSNKKYKKQLIIYLNYSGKGDIISATKSVNNLKNINDKTFKSLLKSSKTPDPDILIRSGGFKRISDFFLYQISFTDFFFTNTLWPDIKKSQIKKFINQFYKIDRKFGS